MNMSPLSSHIFFPCLYIYQVGVGFTIQRYEVNSAYATTESKIPQKCHDEFFSPFYSTSACSFPGERLNIQLH